MLQNFLSAAVVIDREMWANLDWETLGILCTNCKKIPKIGFQDL